jgi:hypothetical protein
MPILLGRSGGRTGAITTCMFAQASGVNPKVESIPLVEAMPKTSQHEITSQH